VLGASVSGILLLLSKDFTRLGSAANIIAWPVAFFAMKKWLQNFTYRTDISWWLFVLSGVLALGIALLTVSYQVVKASLTTPINSLRYE